MAHLREPYEGIHYLPGMPRRRKDIDVLHHLLHAPDAARGLYPVNGRGVLQPSDDVLRQRQNATEWLPVRPAFEQLDAFEDVLFGFLLDARQAAELAFVNGRFK